MSQFSVVLVEIINRVARVHTSGSRSSVFRPQLGSVLAAAATNTRITVATELSTQICKLWSENPRSRPTIQAILARMISLNPYKKLSIADNMIKIMEKYSKQLEETVESRTAQLEEEKKKTEVLLGRMLPESVAEKLKRGQEVEPEAFDCVTIYFSDITGFQSLAAECSPFQLVDILNAVYSFFDGTISRHDVYKVETISDTYVMVSGLPLRNDDMHIVEITNCALDLISGALGFSVPHKPNHKLQMRIGIHTGPIVAGVVGLTMPRYCLFGDTMNTTSRMESHGLPMRIHVSPSAQLAISKFAGYHLASRGAVTIKGKGEMNTFWLTGKTGYTQPLPNYDEMFREDDPPPLRLPVTVGKLMQEKSSKPSLESGFSETTIAPSLSPSNK